MEEFMKRFVYSIQDLSEEDQKVFEEMLPYISPYIESTTVNNSEIIVFHNYSDDEIITKMEYLKKSITSSELNQKKDSEVETIFDNTQIEPLNNKSVYEELLDGHVYKIIDGVFAYSGIFLDVFKYFCKKIDSFGKERFQNIKQFEMPVLYPIDGYEKGSYFESFPHQMMFQTIMVNDIEVLDKFSKLGTKDHSIFTQMKVPENVLRHSACAPVYPYMENQQVDPAHAQCFLVSGKCFRNEGQNVFELARLKEFHQKEYVFIGTPKQCLDYLEESKELWKYWIQVFGLNCKIDTANDSFFASNYKKLKLFQIWGDSKQEFKMQLPSSKRYIAVGSSNVHRTHFTKKYNIRNGDAFCHSSCFGFGIERLTYSLIAQKGMDISKWDERTLNEIRNYIEL